MIVLRIQKAPNHLSGYIRRFLMEVDKGVYVGNVSRRVQDALWQRVITCEQRERVRAVMVSSIANAEQGFVVETWNTRRKILNFDGLALAAKLDPR